MKTYYSLALRPEQARKAIMVILSICLFAALTAGARADVPRGPEEISYDLIDDMDPYLVIALMAAVLAAFTGAVVYYIHRHFAPIASAKTPIAGIQPASLSTSPDSHPVNLRKQ